jgi:small-conductance mechanosensitive channel
MPTSLPIATIAARALLSIGLAPRFARGLVDAFAGYPLEELIWSLCVLVAAAFAGRAASALALRALTGWSKHRKITSAEVIVVELRGPLHMLCPLLAVQQVLPLATIPAALLEDARQLLLVAAIGGMCWLALRVVVVAEVIVVRRFDVASADSLRARTVNTQMRGLRNVASFLIVVVALAFALLSFERVRQLGAGLLASAGLAGIVLGFAAQKSLAAVLSGIQIAFTQPIRLDDVVVVEGEWGRIEELTLTYVVVKIWDGRRLVLPIGYFLEKPFQNWTRREANLLGTVELHLDYATPLDVVRGEFKRLLDQSKLWDGQTWSVQVTDSTEQTVLVRLLMSARDAGAMFDLRCEVREKMLASLHRSQPSCLPRVRNEVSSREGAQKLPTASIP